MDVEGLSDRPRNSDRYRHWPALADLVINVTCTVVSRANIAPASCVSSVSGLMARAGAAATSHGRQQGQGTIGQWSAYRDPLIFWRDARSRPPVIGRVPVARTAIAVDAGPVPLSRGEPEGPVS